VLGGGALTGSNISEAEHAEAASGATTATPTAVRRESIRRARALVT
jgi:hypothetical protein